MKLLLEASSFSALKIYAVLRTSLPSCPVCEGEVGDQVSQNGCSITTSDLLKLQNKCEGKVDSLTGVTR